ncbi:hypothetical protein [Planomonospora parontospora]|uniref:hypothetical protein n=1 Tax=Planomonospora parontospora TaxID=58119 RepID=UPI001670B8F9|nr:hypothetical protein [Planomonospora parontospora]GGL30685.1 hypothetical protein GCM10014719_35050 [Planomonospora parontospora subsp. antibiotica]GII16682.1 hypothetical protein Ppa05_34080 [Planomonospora parontospora subsp. antibiotica]
MSPRSSVVPVVAGGTATVLRLLSATLVFAALYAGAGSLDGPARAEAAGTERVRTVTLSAQAGRSAAERAPEPGTVTVDEVPAGGRCERAYRVRGVIGNPDPEETVSYGWRLQRWSPATRTWRTYLTSGSGFTGASRTAEWEPRIVGNPGLYRVKLSVDGGATLRSEKFMVSC